MATLIPHAGAAVAVDTSSGPARPSIAVRPAPGYDPDHILVRFDAGLPSEQRQIIHTQIGGIVVNRIARTGLVVVVLQEEMTAPAAVNAYRAMPGVAYAGLNDYVVPLGMQPHEDQELPDDELFSDQWALHNDGVDFEAYYLKGLEEDFDIDAPEGWRLMKPRADRRPVRVAIIDSGIERHHRDLINANLAACAQAINKIGTVEKGKCADDYGHGTFMAGIIAAERDNGYAIAGIAPEVELAIVKYHDATFTITRADILAAIAWAADPEGGAADIISISFAMPECEPNSEDERILWEAHNAGVLIVAAAGNKISCAGPPNATVYPSAYPFVLSVGGTNGRGEVWQNYDDPTTGTTCNETVDIMAPAEGVWSLWAKDSPSGLVIGDRFNSQGTSVAAPHVAAVAALVMSQEGLTNVETRERLEATTTEVEPHPHRPGECSGLGQVNLAGALTAGLEPEQLEIDIKPGSNQNSINTNGGGSLPVAIITSDAFDALRVDVASVAFGPASAAATRSAIEDVDHDGDLDLLLHFDESATGFQPGDVVGCLQGATVEGRAIYGCDHVTVR